MIEPTWKRLLVALKAEPSWRTLAQLSHAVGRRGFDASVSARLRDLRKPEYGGWVVERSRRPDGTPQYRLAPNKPLFDEPSRSRRRCRCPSCGGRGYKHGS